MPCELFTIGHSTHSIERFLELLAENKVNVLADVRRFPGSRRLPQFNQENLSTACRESGVEYHWLESLGGRRRSTMVESPNLGLRNESFRAYADYMLTDEFKEGANWLLELAADNRLAYMCAEGLYWQCHRRLISDYLLARGIAVTHIMPSGVLQPHALTSGGQIVGGRVTYPGAEAGQGTLAFE